MCSEFIDSVPPNTNSAAKNHARLGLRRLRNYNNEGETFNLRKTARSPAAALHQREERGAAANGDEGSDNAHSGSIKTLRGNGR